MRLDWQRGILYITTAGIECCWLYALIGLVNRQAVEGRISVSGLLLLYPVAFVFNLLLLRLRWHKLFLGSISWAVWVIAMLLIVKIQLFSGLGWTDTTWLKAVPESIAGVFYGFKPELLILLGTGAIWWLGQRLASLKLSFAASVAEFQFGLAMLLIVFFSASQLEASLGEAVPVTLVFFLFALLGMSLAHAREGKGWLSGLNRHHWTLLLLASIGIIVALGFLIGSLVTPDFLHLIVAALQWLWGLIVYAITFLASLLPGSEPSAVPIPPQLIPPQPSPEESIPWLLSEEARLRLQLVWSVAVGGLVLFALWRISSQIIGWLRRRLAMSGVETEPMTGAFKSDLLSLLKLLLSKLLGLLPSRFMRKSRSALPEAASVRQVYRQLLRWAAAHGYPRRTFQTPFEYYFTLAGVVPEAQEDLDFITRQYVRVRYNSAPPEESELSRLKQSWHNIRQIRLKKSAQTGDKTDGQASKRS